MFRKVLRQNLARKVAECSFYASYKSRNVFQKGIHVSAVLETSDTSSENFTERRVDQLYEGHIRTSVLQKALLGLGSAMVAIRQPWRDDMIATMGETTGYLALQSMQRKMLSDPIGKQILLDRPRINSETVDLNYLRSCEDGTFGREYVRFLDANNVTPDSRRDVMFVDDVDLAYVMQRYREVHDLMHTLLGMPTNMLGEVVVKWFEGIQTGLPMCVTGALFGPVRLGPKHMQRYLETHIWWAIKAGRDSRFFMNVYYEHEWETPVVELRKQMGISAPPKTPHKTKKS